jgi:hypothetical protein
MGKKKQPCQKVSHSTKDSTHHHFVLEDTGTKSLIKQKLLQMINLHFQNMQLIAGSLSMS